MVQYGSAWFKMIQDDIDTNRFKKIQDVSKWFKMVQDGSRWFKKVCGSSTNVQ